MRKSRVGRKGGLKIFFEEFDKHSARGNTHTSQKRANIYEMATSDYTGFPATEYFLFEATNFH